MQADRDKLYQHVAYISAIYPYRNYKNIESLQKTADYIFQEFNQTKLLLSAQEWEANKLTYQNIIASYLPEKKRRFIVGAHYDVYKEQPGADDNASSIAGLLEIARLLSIHQPDLEYGIDLIAYCLEEPPFFKTKQMGSYIHAKSVHEHQQDIIGMIALEMIGYYEGKIPDHTKWLVVSGIKKYDAFNKYLSDLLKKGSNIASRRISFSDNYKNNGPSDHRNYWLFDYPAAMVIGTGGKGNPHYHLPSDTIDTLDFDTMTKAVNGITFAITHLNLDSI